MFIVVDRDGFSATPVNNPPIAEALSQIDSERRSGLDAERNRLDAAAFKRRGKDGFSRMLPKGREFFGLSK